MTENRPIALNERLEAAGHIHRERIRLADARFINACHLALEGPDKEVADRVRKARRERINAYNEANVDHVAILTTIAPHLEV